MVISPKMSSRPVGTHHKTKLSTSDGSGEPLFSSHMLDLSEEKNREISLRKIKALVVKCCEYPGSPTTIFYRLVYEFHHFSITGLSSYKRNHYFLNGGWLPGNIQIYPFSHNHGSGVENDPKWKESNIGDIPFSTWTMIMGGRVHPSTRNSYVYTNLHDLPILKCQFCRKTRKE